MKTWEIKKLKNGWMVSVNFDDCSGIYFENIAALIKFLSKDLEQRG